MEYRTLGNTGIKVSRLCFGSLTIGPLQSNLNLEDGAKIIAYGIEHGINFIDAAVLYKTFPYVRRAIEITGRNDIVISTRSYDYTYEGMKKTVNEALNALGVDCIDIFGLHEQEDIYTLKGHSDAIRYLSEAKAEGKIRAVSISTHNVAAVKAACKMPEIDVIHPLLNIKGIGIGDGNVQDMLSAIEMAKKWGKGIYSMKPIGGGNLIPDIESCFKFVLDNPNIDSIAVGMQSKYEVMANVALFEGKSVSSDIKEKLRTKKRRLLIDYWCEGCGRCVKRCKTGALKLVDGKSVVDQDKCTLCGYCSTVCPQFCIKVI
jgi:predicted aldo/keto reductase-like oxidoreductase